MYKHQKFTYQNDQIKILISKDVLCKIGCSSRDTIFLYLLGTRGCTEITTTEKTFANQRRTSESVEESRRVRCSYRWWWCDWSWMCVRCMYTR